ncbi:uncharacterized protein LOC112906466 [Agrilus planipennis]|uniref:Uncharacterized protein LOC108734497 n=1 Tax=Agrilus planipennis TaxID=224129 RepID=A0A1W4WMA8_AGRPL|nr:uncharacterized protein LOC108734497 [Agrilus planipennis]XP_025836431.1 uncharacterized protein LOC112906466 [Agrilus planipennis]
MNSLYSTVVLLLLFFNAVLSDSQSENDTESSSSDRSDYKRSLFEDCNSGFSFTCMKLELVSWVDKMSQENEYNLIPGVSLVREANATTSNTAELIAEMAKSFPSDPDSRLNMALFKKISGFLNGHSVKVKLLPDVETVAGRAGGGGGLGGGGGGGGKKGGGGLGMLLAGAAMMKGTLLALALGALAALAGKALMTGLIALLLSSIIGLKSLTSGGGKTTYEVVAKPIYTHEKTHSVSHEDYHDHGHGHYRRSFDDLPLPLGLQPGYKP